MRPVVRYFGGKFLLAPWIVSHMPKHRVYVEPFGGAASVLLNKPRSYAEIYNDLDDSIYSLFAVLRSESESAKLKALLINTPFSRREFEMAMAYTPDPIEKARRIIIRSFMGFGADSVIDRTRSTGFRANSNRSGSTPAHDWVNYAQYIDIFHKRLMGVVLENRNAVDVIISNDGPETLHYLDPPYMAATRTKARAKNYSFELSDRDHLDLLHLAKKLKGSVIISGYDHDLYNGLLSDWKKITKVHYADGAKKRCECLWIKEAASDKSFHEENP